MRNNKGITLVSLIASLLLVIILAATTVVTSMNAYNQMKFEGAKAELEEMQKLVDEIAADYQTYLKETDATKEYVDYFKDRYGAEGFSSKLLSSRKGEAKTLLSNYSELETASASSKTAFYFTGDELVKYFDLKGIDDVVVDFSTRSVYSVNGIKDSNDNNKIYYTPSDWGTNKGSTSKDTNPKAPIASASQISKSGTTYDVQITITPKLGNKITEVYINAGEKFIKLDNIRDISNDQNTIIRVTVEGSGTYKFRLVDDLKNVYETSATLN